MKNSALLPVDKSLLSEKSFEHFDAYVLNEDFDFILCRGWQGYQKLHEVIDYWYVRLQLSHVKDFVDNPKYFLSEKRLETLVKAESLKEGMKIYKSGARVSEIEYYPQIIKSIDKEKGIITILEEGIGKTTTVRIEDLRYDKELEFVGENETKGNIVC